MKRRKLFTRRLFSQIHLYLDIRSYYYSFELSYLLRSTLSAFSPTMGNIR